MTTQAVKVERHSQREEQEPGALGKRRTLQV
jgi:hypothetical protein